MRAIKEFVVATKKKSSKKKKERKVSPRTAKKAAPKKRAKKSKAAVKKARKSARKPAKNAITKKTLKKKARKRATKVESNTSSIAKTSGEPPSAVARPKRVVLQRAAPAPAPPSSRGNTFYITTAIAYPNGLPHIGHAYEAIATDALARFQRLEEQRPQGLPAPRCLS